MSAQFSKGDRVEWRGCGDTGRKGTLATPADSDDPYSQVTVAWDNGTVGTVRIGALRKVEPEFVVGQQVSGDDYERLPVGAKAATQGVGAGITKVGEHEWHDSHGCPLFDVTDFPRILTHLPATEPEDTDDLYVEPGRMSKFIKGQTIRCINDKDQGTTANESLAYGAEYVIAETSGFAVRLADGDAFWDEDRFTAVLSPEPEDTDDVEPEPLKEGDAVLVWARVDNAEPDNEGDLHFDAGGNNYSGFYLPSDSDAIVRPGAGQVPPWVKRAPLTIDPNDEDGAVAELAHAIAEHCGVSVTFADLAKALAERSAAEGGAS